LILCKTGALKIAWLLMSVKLQIYPSSSKL
jgi:hypothetical protein